MRIIKKAIGIIQPHIVMVFSVLLFLSFAMVGLAFNIAINEYIKSGAESALNEARAVYEGYDINEASMIMRALGGNHRFMHSNVDVFAVRGTYEIYEPFHDITEIPYSVHAPMISEFLAERQVSLVLTNVRRLRADNHTFYVSVLPRSSGALIFYLDVTDILTFTTVVNRLLLVSVAMIWLISMI
ncbi:MAG: hypothetical protein LBI27_00485, partial [Clostridiales bacterium]|nr:hypothetical protein [Clostridiales bacterium]